ncbi:IS3 family transposase, partial [bacterium]|nr:IS3 family transposase [bacterium]MBQ2872162.1 IS3 family transposase [bacterium]
DQYMYYYNNERYQWSRNKMAPVEYRNHLLKAS